jgi:hypothetical protein
MTANVIEEVAPAWPSTIRDEFEANQLNGRVGTRFLSETDRVRVWEIRLAPGERIGFHRHVLDYFWTAVTPGRARSHTQDGSVVEATYAAGDTRPEAGLSRPKSPQQRSVQARMPVNSEQDCCSWTAPGRDR